MPPAAAPPAAGPPSLQPTTPDFAARLRENGAGACASQVNQLAAGTMSSVAQFNSVSHWASDAINKRLVNVSIGQQYGNGSKIPFGATTVVAVPGASGNCDGIAVQVLPSPLPCETLRKNIAAHGSQVAILAGVRLMNDATGEKMLIATAANTCVLMTVRLTYAK